VPGGVKTIQDVVERQLCTGCGVCAYLYPDGFQMVDSLELGRRPMPTGALRNPSLERAAFRACPGKGLERDSDRLPEPRIAELEAAWGPVLDLWEGHASDPEIRFAASSGGASTALALFCLEQGGAHGVLHSVARSDVPYLNTTVMSCNRADLLRAAGSRYAPASPCDGLAAIEEAPAPCVFVGKPCDAAAVAKAAADRPKLREKLAVTIAFFCAGTPSTQGTLAMLRRMGIDHPDQISEIRYRGMGWPGLARAQRDDGSETTLTYDESWGLLQSYRQWRCYVCADHTGEFADIAVGDPWYRPIEPDEPGTSLILSRTQRGREIVHAAIAAGYLNLRRVDARILPASQPNLLWMRGSIWARLWVTRAMGAAAPRYRGFSMFRYWLSELTLRDKLNSVFGTMRRVFRKGLRQRIRVIPYRPTGDRSQVASSGSHVRNDSRS